MANDSMRPDQQLQSLQYAALLKLDELETAKKGSASAVQSTSKLGALNAALLEQNAKLLEKLKGDVAAMSGSKTAQHPAAPVSGSVPTREQKTGETDTQRMYRIKGDVGDELEKRGVVGKWDGVFDHPGIQIIEVPLEKADSPVELPKSHFSFGDSTPLALRKSDEVPGMPKSQFSFGD